MSVVNDGDEFLVMNCTTCEKIPNLNVSLSGMTHDMLWLKSMLCSLDTNSFFLNWGSTTQHNF